MIEQQKTVHHAPYRAGPKAREVGKSETNEMLEIKVIEHHKMEWEATIMFAVKEDCLIGSHVDFGKIVVVTEHDCPPYQQCISASSHLETH